jgi:thiol:disulfide interchange protein
MATYLLQALAAFGAGFGTSLSPCVYPMIPITVGFLGSAGTGEGNRRGRILGFFFGQVISFTALGVIAVTLGEFLGFSSELPAVQLGTGVLLLVFAYFSFFDKLPAFFYQMNRGKSGGNAATFGGAFLVGASSAAVASPCTSPVVGGMLTALSQVGNRGWGMALMFSFALGLSILFLIIGLGLAKTSSLPRAGAWMTKIHKASSVLLAVGGIYFLSKGLRLI